MIKNIAFLMVAFTWFFAGCEKEIDYPLAPIHFPGTQEYGWSIASKNGQAFEASGFGLKHTDRPDDFLGVELRESIYIAELDYDIGTYNVVTQDADQENGIPIGFYATLSDDGDVTEDVYELDERQNNWIEITTIDTIAGEPTISGKYNLHFKIKRAKTNPLNPGHVRFTDGKFEVRFEQ
jgi:hypothetical protein